MLELCVTSLCCYSAASMLLQSLAISLESCCDGVGQLSVKVGSTHRETEPRL